MTSFNRLNNRVFPKPLPASNQGSDDEACRGHASRTDVTRLCNGEKASIVELRGSAQFLSTMKALGIRPGTSIVKKSAALLQGPVVLEKEGVQFAIGRGLARKIIVETLHS